MLFSANVAPNTLSETELAKLKPITECQEKILLRIVLMKNCNGLSLISCCLNLAGTWKKKIYIPLIWKQ